MRGASKQIAFGGMMGALAVTIMAMGGLIPVATYVCPMLCILILQLVLMRCGSRIGWAWYGAVSILGLLLGPDKEAAMVFLFLGYYPIVKPTLDKRKCSWLFKGLLFNGAILSMYWLLLNLIGMEQLTEEFSALGMVLTAVLLAMGNVIFVMLDFILSRLPEKLKKGRA